MRSRWRQLSTSISARCAAQSRRPRRYDLTAVLTASSAAGASMCPNRASCCFPIEKLRIFRPRTLSLGSTAVEAATEAIREELLVALSADGAGIEPYIAYEEGLPLKQWKELNHSRRWSAYFLWNPGPTGAGASGALSAHGGGARRRYRKSIFRGAARRRSSRFLTRTPRFRAHRRDQYPRDRAFAADRAARLRAFASAARRASGSVGTAGYSTIRLSTRRGTTRMHARAILIFDIWNPELTLLERDLVREATLALADYRRGRRHPAGSTDLRRSSLLTCLACYRCVPCPCAAAETLAELLACRASPMRGQTGLLRSRVGGAWRRLRRPPPPPQDRWVRRSGDTLGGRFASSGYTDPAPSPPPDIPPRYPMAAVAIGLSEKLRDKRSPPAPGPGRDEN